MAPQTPGCLSTWVFLSIEWTSLAQIHSARNAGPVLKEQGHFPAAGGEQRVEVPFSSLQGRVVTDDTQQFNFCLLFLQLQRSWHGEREALGLSLQSTSAGPCIWRSDGYVKGGFAQLLRWSSVSPGMFSPWSW